MNTLKQLPELTALVEAGKNPFNQVLMDYVDQGGKTVGFMYQDLRLSIYYNSRLN